MPDHGSTSICSVKVRLVLLEKGGVRQGNPRPRTIAIWELSDRLRLYYRSGHTLIRSASGLDLRENNNVGTQPEATRRAPLAANKRLPTTIVPEQPA